MIFLPHLGIEGLKAGRQNYGPHFYFFLLRRLIEIYGLILTYCFADTTFLLFEVKTALIDICHKGNCLREVYMDRFILRYVLIKLIGVLGRAVCHAGSATRAFIFYNVSGLFDQRYVEVSRFPFYVINFSVRQDFYVGMPADLDQLGCEYSHRAVISGKGLVKLGHMAPNARPFLNQVHLKTGIRKIEGSLNTADPPTDDHDVSDILIVSDILTKLLNIFF